MKSLRSAALLVALSLALQWLPAVWAAPQAQSGNLLSNPGFESAGSTGSGTANWLPWWTESPKPSDGSFNYAYRPNWNQESLSAGASSAFVYSGNSAQRIINNWDPWWAGVKQTVSAPAGARVRFTIYARVWVSGSGWPSASDTSAPVRVQVGLDPNGGENQYSGSVVWSGGISPYDTWQPVSVEATVGSGGRVGVFASADYRGASRQWLAASLDEASLTVVNANPAPTTAPSTGGNPAPTSAPVVPAATAAPFVMPTPGQDGNIIYVVKPGDSAWGIAANAKMTLDQLSALNGGVNLNFITVGQRLVIGQGKPSAAPTATTAPASTTAPGAAVSPTPAATAASQGAAGPTAAPAQATAANSGKICATVYEDTNGNALRDPNENPIPGASLTVIDAASGAPVQAYTTLPGEPAVADDPQHCFDNIAPGAYTLAAAPPSGYNATTSATARLDVQTNATVKIEFGAQKSSAGAANAATGTATNASADQRMRTALFGAAGIMLILLAAGIAGFLFLRRR